MINNNQAADGESAITLVVTFKDASGNPIPDAEVKFIDDSPTVEISGGTTNALGEFRTTVKSTVPEKINVTPVVKDILGEHRTIEDVRKRMHAALEKEGNNPSTVKDQLKWLSDAGFKAVDCVWKYYHIAVIVGLK